jgi:hypothetical protein
MHALERTAGETSSACAARLRQGTYDVIANTDLRDVGTNFGNNSGNLVTKYCRERDDIVGSEKQVGMTQARGSHVDEDFASYRRSNVHVLEVKSMSECVNYKCLHSRLLVFALSRSGVPLSRMNLTMVV